VLPGGLDPHVHFNEPGRTHWEGWATGTAALAAGGMTACFDMPLNSHPPTTDAAGFDAKLAAARASARVDFGLWGGLVPGNLDHVEELFERGVVGFKAFMSASGVDDFHAADDRTLYDGMALCARLGALVAVHAENDALTSGPRGGRTARDYAASRPPIAEIEAIGRAIAFADDTGCALHVVHVSTGRGVDLVTQARARGVDVTCETCPHYLFLGEADMEALGAVAKCAPPLRDPAPLWARIDDIALVASDHSPSPPELKDPDDYFFAWGGIAGAQTTLPLLLGATDPATVARLASAGAAERFGIAGKGRLEVGLDADLALVDLAAEQELRAEDLHYRHRLSPFLGRRLPRVVRTLLRGAEPVAGRLMTPDSSSRPRTPGRPDDVRLR
jgi:allantoinase